MLMISRKLQNGDFSQMVGEEILQLGPLSGIPVPGTGTREKPEMMPPPGLMPPSMIRMLNGGQEPPDISALIREMNTPNNSMATTAIAQQNGGANMIPGSTPMNMGIQ